jgi:peptidylprolyl isomerase
MLRKGAGKTKPGANDRVEVHYSAWTSDGALFDSSVVRGTPATVPVGRVIPGWSEGLQHMVEGDKALFWIPEKLAYGGRVGSPQGMLVYEVELLKIAR